MSLRGWCRGLVVLVLAVDDADVDLLVVLEVTDGGILKTSAPTSHALG